MYSIVLQIFNPQKLISWPTQNDKFEQIWKFYVVVWSRKINKQVKFLYRFLCTILQAPATQTSRQKKIYFILPCFYYSARENCDWAPCSVHTPIHTIHFLCWDTYTNFLVFVSPKWKNIKVWNFACQQYIWTRYDK